MAGKDLVLDAINFDNPTRVPIWFFNRDHHLGDLLYFVLDIQQGRRNEWGYEWEDLGDGTMGQPAMPVIPTWEDFPSFHVPQLCPDQRTRGIDDFNSGAGGRYLLAGLGITGFSKYTFLRGFENAMTDFLLEPQLAGNLLDQIFSFENELITLAAELGLHGVHFQDDWGTQDDLIISPRTWREVFKSRYRAQFDHAHGLGLHVWFHCCGNIVKILPDFHEIGVDVMNISQPNVVDIPHVGALLRDKQCFMAPISYQTVSITGTPDTIKSEAKRLHSELGTQAGGFIGYVEEYGCVGMSEENYQACIDAFRQL